MHYFCACQEGMKNDMMNQMRPLPFRLLFHRKKREETGGKSIPKGRMNDAS